MGLIFVILRLHLNIFWNWGLIFIPFWFSLLIWIFIDVHGVIQSQKTQEWARYFVSGLGAILLALFLAFVAVKEQLQPGWPWSAVISPLWATLLMYILLMFTYQTFGPHELMLALTYLCLVPASVVIAVRLDSSPTSTIASVNWAILFIPLWTLLLIWLIELISSIVTKVRKDTSHIKKKPYWFNVFVVSLMWVGLSVFMILLTLEIQTPGSIGFLFVFTPMIIVLAAIFLGPYVLLATRRKSKTRESYLPWLTGVTPIFWDFAAPTDLRTGKQVWIKSPSPLASSHAESRLPEESDAPMSVIKRTLMHTNGDSL